MAHVKCFVPAVVVLVHAACVSPQAFRTEEAANRTLRRQLADLQDHQSGLEAENRRLAEEVARLGKNAVDADYIKQQKEKLRALIEQFEKGGARAIEGVSPIVTAEGVGFQVRGGILFASGQAAITAAGRRTLDQLLPTLRKHARSLRVDGHTDSDPIKRSKWKSNLQLSAARAVAVAEYLTAHGLARERVWVAGFGPHRPSVAGSSGAAKRANRRVEILMLNE